MQFTHRIHLEIDEFATGQGDDHLALVDGALDDALAPGTLPLVHTLVRPDVSNAVGVDLKK